MALEKSQLEYKRRVRAKESRIKKEVKAARSEQEHIKTVISEKYGLSQIEEEFKGKTEAEKLRLTYTELVRRLAIESHRNFICEVDWDDENTVSRRKKQLENIIKMLQTTRMLNELITQLESTTGRNTVLSIDEQKEADNVIDIAQQMLKRKTNI